MTIVRCPRCGDEVTLPPQAPSGALVRCPLCLEEYLLAEATAQVPPTLVLLRAPQSQAAITASDESEPDAEAEYRLSEAHAMGAVAAQKPLAGDGAALRPMLRTSPRQARKEKSAVAGVLKVVLGGVVGLALGLLVLWWFFDQDDFGLGPEVAKYAPWMVPTKFRGMNAANPSMTTGKVQVVPRAGAVPSADESAGLMTLAEPALPQSEQRQSAESDTIPLALPDVPFNRLGGGSSGGRFVPAPPMPDLTDLLPDDAAP